MDVLQDDRQWFEAELLCEPSDFYRRLFEEAHPDAVLSAHHFYEPWHPDGPVCRLLLDETHAGDVFDLLRGWDAVGTVGSWSREDDDRSLYQQHFDDAMAFFDGSSALAGVFQPPDALVAKLIHCVLNAHGLKGRDERRWARKFAWGRHTLPFRLFWRQLRTGKVWWAR